MDKKIFFYEKWCKNCGICAAFCPKGAITMEKMTEKPVWDESKCIQCGFCELRCPDFAVVVNKDKNKKKKGRE
ncbi:MAG: 4Fe-4S binding protein [Candidatus Muiribacteriota bacterium]